MFGLFKKKPSQSQDALLGQVVQTTTDLLALQLPLAGSSPPTPIVDTRGQINKKAAGYVYGYVDAALRVVGKDMSDMEVGIPVTFQVLRHTFPGHEERLMTFLIEHMGKDSDVMTGAMRGGQQYLDFINNKKPGFGLARYLLGEG